MSWDQGIQLREDVEPRIIEAIEKRFEERYGYKAELQYITWFGLGYDLIFDFGMDNPALKLTRSV